MCAPGAVASAAQEFGERIVGINRACSGPTRPFDGNTSEGAPDRIVMYCDPDVAGKM
jgi:hypothetical protein